MNSIEKLLELHEGIKLKPYRDIVGKLTIGIGRNLDDVGISTEEAYELFDHDLQKVIIELQRTFNWWINLDHVRQAVLMDMCFNLGIGGLQKFYQTDPIKLKNGELYTLNYVEKGDYKIASQHMLQSLWATQVKGRAVRLAKMMETGEWPND